MIVLISDFEYKKEDFILVMTPNLADKICNGLGFILYIITPIPS